MKHIYDIDHTKKSTSSSRYIKGINDITPHFNVNFTFRLNSQRSTHQNSCRQLKHVTTSWNDIPSTRNSKINGTKGKSHLRISPTAEQKIERKNKDLFNQFVLNINDTPFNKYTNHVNKHYIKPIQQKKAKHKSQSQVKIEITEEEIFQYKHIDNYNINLNHKKNSKSNSKKKKRLSTGSFRLSNKTEMNNTNEKYYKNIYRDLSWTDLAKKRTMYNRAENILHSFVNQSKRDKSDKDKLDKKQNKCKLVANKNHRIQSEKLQSAFSPHTRNSVNIVPNTRNTSYSKNISTNISNTHLTSEKFDVNSYEEIHFLFVEAFQKKKRFLNTTSISKQNSIEID